MMGGAPGTLSKTKLRTENDLSPTEGKLILVEYAEERPPIQLTKGMAFKIVNYYRGDKSRCPVSAGGGDRPAARRKRIVEETTATQSTKAVVKRLDTTAHDDIMDWVGKLPKRSKGSEEKTKVNVLPEGKNMGVLGIWVRVRFLFFLLTPARDTSVARYYGNTSPQSARSFYW